MRRLCVLLLVVVPAVLAGASSQRAVLAPSPTRTFRVATFNIHKGADRPGRYDLEQTIETIRHLDADLVGVQEALRNHAGYNCDDQPALIAEGLRRRTGRPWRHAYAKSWVTENRQCLERGRGDGVQTEGVAFFTPERIVASSSVRLSAGRVGLVVRIASMPHVPVIVTHLAANRENQAGRVREIAALLPWAEQQGPGLLMGRPQCQAGGDRAYPGDGALSGCVGRSRRRWPGPGSRIGIDAARPPRVAHRLRTLRAGCRPDPPVGGGHRPFNAVVARRGFGSPSRCGHVSRRSSREPACL